MTMEVILSVEEIVRDVVVGLGKMINAVLSVTENSGVFKNDAQSLVKYSVLVLKESRYGTFIIGLIVSFLKQCRISLSVK